MENAVSTVRNGFVSENSPRENSPDWRLSLLHYTNLNTRSVGSKKYIWIFFNKKSILHIAGRVLKRKIQSRKNVPVIFNFWPFRNNKPKPAKDFNNLVTNNCQRMTAS